VFKVNPPLRTAEDVEALRAGLADGTVDCVATDHAPHALEDKEAEWGAASPGMTGLETALAVVVDALGTGRQGLSWRALAERMSATPARIGRLEGHGRPVAVGEPANLTVVDPAAPWTVDAARMATRSSNTPFAGRELPVRVVATFLRGVPTVLDGAPA
jgi:dihydroorotase